MKVLHFAAAAKQKFIDETWQPKLLSAYYVQNDPEETFVLFLMMQKVV